MTHHHFLLFLHLLAASVWIGGHLVLALSHLPAAIRENRKEIVLNFQARFERVGMPSLIILVITGVAMAYDYNTGIDRWFSFANPVEWVVSLKLALLGVTLGLAILANKKILPHFKTTGKFAGVSALIITVTIIGIVMAFLGSSIRFGGIF